MRRKKQPPCHPSQSTTTHPADADDLTAEDLDAEADLELADKYWEVLLLDDDYEPLPEPGDFDTD